MTDEELWPFGVFANVSTPSQEERNKVVTEVYNNFPQQLQRENSLQAALYAIDGERKEYLLWISIR